MLNDLDKDIVRQLQEDLPIVPNPFKILSEQLGIPEEEYIKRTRYLVENGYIRRFGAALNHRRVGFSANAMVVWIVPDERVKDIGKIMASVNEVSHCYQRPTFEGWPYNMFTMVHGKSYKECEKIAKIISEKTGINEYRLIYSTRELKKSSMKYFLES
jgi:siroheme decarboxylase